MNKFMFLSVVTIGVIFALTAEAQKNNKLADRPIDWSSELKLSKEQKMQVREIYKQSHEHIKSLRQQINTLHREIAEVHESDDEKIRLLLTEKQQKKFDKLKERQNKQKPEFEQKNSSKKSSFGKMRQYGIIQM